MSLQFLNYFSHKGRNHLKYIDEDGRIRYEEVRNYTPDVFIHTTDRTKVDGWSIFGQPLMKISEGENQWELKNLIEQYDSSNFPVYGYSKTINSYVYDKFKGHKADFSKVHTMTIDIETEVEGGFPEPLLARERVNIIGVHSSRTNIYTVFYLFGSDLKLPDGDVRLKGFREEKDLLLAFIHFLEEDYPDILTGWNIEGFDLVYLYNRMSKILSEGMVQRLSPFGIVTHREGHDDFGNDVMYIEIKGVSIVDYMLIYKKFILKPRDSYGLDHIGEVELKETKLKHHSGIEGHLLYQTPEFFIDGVKYNIQDVKLVVKLERKLKLLYLTQVVSYIAFTNFEDVLSNMRLIDMMCYTFLRDQKKYFTWKYNAPPKMKYEGAAVKETIPGRYRWAVSFDVTSEYPSLIRSMNISPETLLELMFNIRPSTIIAKEFKHYEQAKKENFTVAGNGTTYRRDKDGFLPEIVRMLFVKRAHYKELKVEADKAHNEELAREYDIYQNAMKVILNSIYGVTGNRFFRFYDIRMAEAITLSGQAMIGWIIRDVNAALQKLLGDTKDRVIASDTDSIYVDMEDVVLKKFGPSYDDKEAEAFIIKFSDTNMNDLIEKSIEKFAEYLNCIDREALSMKREVIADDAIFIAKKRYVMSILNQEGAVYERGEKIKVVGVEAIKSSTPKVCRDAMQDVFKILLHSPNTKTDFHTYVSNFEKKFYGLIPQEVADNEGVNGISKYMGFDGEPIKGTPKNSRAAIVYNKFIKDRKIDDKYREIKEGDKIKYITLNLPNPTKHKVIGWPQKYPEEMNELRQYMDYDSQYTKLFGKPIHEIAAICGIKPDTDTCENPFL